MNMFGVYHLYDVDGEFGDAVCKEDLIALFACEDDANKFVLDHQNPHVYDRPYCDLVCGELVVRPIHVYAHGEAPVKKYWWEEDDENV